MGPEAFNDRKSQAPQLSNKLMRTINREMTHVFKVSDNIRKKNNNEEDGAEVQDLKQELVGLHKKEKNVMGRLQNLMIGGEGQATELMPGRNKFEVMHGVPAYF